MISNHLTTIGYMQHISYCLRESTEVRQPNLFGVGPGRSGTTYLYELFAKHPNFLVSGVKELNYFGVNDAASRPLGISEQEHERLFVAPIGRDARYVCDISPVYLANVRALDMIKRYNPDARIIITLCDPADRFYSQFVRHRKHHGYEKFSEYTTEALRAFIKSAAIGARWFDPVMNLRQSLYADDILKSWLLFSEERVCVLRFEVLKSDPAMWASCLSRFSGEEDFVDLPRPMNANIKSPRSEENVETMDLLDDFFSADQDRLLGML